MRARNEVGFRRCLEQSGINLRWNLENKKSYLKSCEYYIDFYEHLYGREMPKDKGAKILEVGCGFGWFVYYMDRKKYRNIFGIDTDASKINLIKRFGINKVEKADVFDFLRNKRNYDLIILTCVLEHIPKKKVFEILSLVNKSLKKGGKIVITVPNMESPLNLRMRYLDFTHESGFTVNALLHALYYSGFGRLRVRDQFIMPKNTAKKKRYIKAVNFVKKLYDDLCVRAPLFFAEHIICSGMKDN